jgi:hypothetical protein
MSKAAGAGTRRNRAATKTPANKATIQIQSRAKGLPERSLMSLSTFRTPSPGRLGAYTTEIVRPFAGMSMVVASCAVTLRNPPSNRRITVTSVANWYSSSNSLPVRRGEPSTRSTETRYVPPPAA